MQDFLKIFFNLFSDWLIFHHEVSQLMLTVFTENFINEYIYAATEKSDIIGPEGMEKFCEDIGVEPENVC